VVVLVLPLGACSEDPKPKFAPRGSSSPAATSAEPSPSNPVGTVRAWVAARNAALDSGDTRAVEGLSARGCTTCSGLIDPIKRIYAAGGHFETSGWRIMKVKPRDTAGSKPVVDTAISISGGATVTEAGGEPNKYPREEHLVVFKLARDSDAWGIKFVGFLS
jgi:hypothetical protein